MAVRFRDPILAQRQHDVLRVRHWYDTGGIDGLQLVDHREDRVELDAHFLRLRSIDLDARKAGDAMDVGDGKGHGGLAIRRLDGQGGLYGTHVGARSGRPAIIGKFALSRRAMPIPVTFPWRISAPPWCDRVSYCHIFERPRSFSPSGGRLCRTAATGLSLHVPV